MKNLLNNYWLQLNSLSSDSYQEQNSSIESDCDAHFNITNQPKRIFDTGGIPT